MSTSHYIYKSGTVGAVGAAITKWQHPNATLDVPILGKDVPLWAMSGIAVGVGSLLGGITLNKVMPQIPETDTLRYPVAASLAAGTAGAGTAAAYYLANAPSVSEIGLSKLFIWGAASEVIGEWIYNMYIGPTVFQDTMTEGGY